MKRALILPVLALLSLASNLRAEDATVAAGNLNFTLPSAAWKTVPSSSPMRAAVLNITVEGVEKPLEAIFYYFGAGQGGDTNANVNRWLSQFEGSPVSQRDELAAGDKKVTIVTATGTYMDGAMFGPKTAKADYTLLGAIVPGPEAPVFIKLTGPKAAISKITDDFKKLAASPFATK